MYKGFFYCKLNFLPHFQVKLIPSMYFKILHSSLNHHGFQYKEGLNVDTVPFNPNGRGQPGGLYFATEENILDFDRFGTLIADVEIPKSAKVHHEGNCAKANKIIIKNIRPLVDYINETPESAMRAVHHCGSMLKHIKKQTPELCLEAVKNYGCALQHVKEQTHEICLEAVKQHGHALFYVKEQTRKICSKAVKNHGMALRYVKEQTPELCLRAVQNDGHALMYVKEKTPEICLAAVKKNGSALLQVDNQTPEICLEAVKSCPDILGSVKEQTYEMCLIAVKFDKRCLGNVKDPEMRKALQPFGGTFKPVRRTYSCKLIF